MPREIWLAPILSDNRERLLERAREVLTTGPAEGLLYLVPSRSLLELAAGRLLDGELVPGVWGSLPVHLFRGFARFVLATAVETETGLPLIPRIAIDQQELPLRRSLISQIIKRLARDGKLRAIAPLANREGCINTIATLIGEIQRAAKSQTEFKAIVDARARDLYPGLSDVPADSSGDTGESIPLQGDFDREIALIYSEYEAALDRFGLTEDNKDQLRALDVLRGEVDGKRVDVPWLSDVRLLVVDGFFDFTPVQGEVLRLLIPQIANVIVNLNRDERNVAIFRPFERVVDQLRSMAEFDVRDDAAVEPVSADLAPLRERLFNPPLGAQASQPASSSETEIISGEEQNASQGKQITSGEKQITSGEAEISSFETQSRLGCLRSQASQGITVLDCADRQTELRAIAKEIKRLVLLEGYSTTEIAVVVRRRAPYEDAITRIFAEENIRTTLSRRVALMEAPAVRAAMKLFELLIELGREGGAMKVGQIADLVKSGYFGLPESELATLRERFELEDRALLEIPGYRKAPEELNVGCWDADELENSVAYVGGDLRVQTWIHRARKLAYRTAETPDEKSQDIEPEGEAESEDDTTPSMDESVAVRMVRARRIFEPVDVPLPGSERRSKPAREVHPALIAWSALIMDRFTRLLTDTPREASPGEMREAVMRLLDRVQFAREVRASRQASVSDDELPALTLDLRGLEGLRRALAAATRSIEISEQDTIEGQPKPLIRLATLLEETIRCIKGQSLVLSGGDPDGLKVLEATDIRGLRFRAVFVAGLIEGSFPSRTSRDWIYPHEERERLKLYGLTLEDISPDTLLKEEHYFYQSACRATERLYLTRPLVLEDGSETVASYYIEEVVRAVEPATVHRQTVRNDFDGRTLFDASRTPELAVLVVRQEERLRHRAQMSGNFSDDVIARLIVQASENGYMSESARRRIKIERERGGRAFGKFDGLVDDALLIEKLKNQYGIIHDFSASELSLYGKCPFKFFAEKVLRLEPRGEAALDLSALDAGSLLHEVLRRFFEPHRNQRLTDFDRAELRRELGQAADAVFDEHERAVPPLNPQVWRIDRDNKKLLLEQVLDYELTVEEQTRSRDVRPAYFELAFGMQNDAIDPASTELPFEIKRFEGDQTETVRLRGQIDRVDVANDGSGTATAYDYKLSRGASLDDMTSGRALQLHVYLGALEKLLLPGQDLAGGGYYTLKGVGPRRNQGLYRKSKKDYTGVNAATASSLDDPDWARIRVEMQTRIWEFIDGMRGGDFTVAPSAPEATCPHCDFSAVCRYEKYRIRRKEEHGNW